jgi:hypothetical protein
MDFAPVGATIEAITEDAGPSILPPGSTIPSALMGEQLPSTILDPESQSSPPIRNPVRWDFRSLLVGSSDHGPAVSSCSLSVAVDTV